MFLVGLLASVCKYSSNDTSTTILNEEYRFSPPFFLSQRKSFVEGLGAGMIASCLESLHEARVRRLQHFEIIIARLRFEPSYRCSIYYGYRSTASLPEVCLMTW